MATVVSRELQKQLPANVRMKLDDLDEGRQMAFADLYKSKSKSKGTMIALAILFPIQHFLLGKVGLGIAFWLTGGGFGVWYLIEIFMVSGRVDKYNEEIAEDALADVKTS